MADQNKEKDFEAKISALQIALDGRDEEVLRLIAELDEYKAKTARMEDEIQREVNRRMQEIAKGGKRRVVIPGTVELTLENANTGKPETVTVEVKNGIPSISDGKEVLGTDQLLRLANGEKLSEADLAKFPAMANLTKESAIAKLTTLFAKGAGFLQRVAAMLVLAVLTSLLLPTQAEAQVRDGRFYIIPADTITNAGTEYVYFPNIIWDFNEYDYTVQFVTNQVSGTSTLTVTSQESMIETGTSNSLFVDIDTTAFAGATTDIIQNDIKGIRVRWKCTNAGTGVMRFYGVVRVRKKKSVQ